MFDPDQIVQTYETDIAATHIDFNKVIPDIDMLGNNININITCWYLSKATKPQGFASQGNKYQYDLRGTGVKTERPLAWRVPFLALFPIEFEDKNWTVSHLCHDDQCYNPGHHWFEPLDSNKGRNGCPGPNHGCRHIVKCLIPGPNCAD